MDGGTGNEMNVAAVKVSINETKKTAVNNGQDSLDDRCGFLRGPGAASLPRVSADDGRLHVHRLQ